MGGVLCVAIRTPHRPSFSPVSRQSENEFLISQTNQVTVSDCCFCLRGNRLIVDIGSVFGVQVDYEATGFSGDNVGMTPADRAVVGYKVVNIAAFFAKSEHGFVYRDGFSG